MATLSASSTLYSISNVKKGNLSSTRLHSLPKTLHLNTRTSKNPSFCSSQHGFKKQNFHGLRKLRSVEEESIVAEEQEAVEEQGEGGEEQQQQQEATVSVPVSPSDKLTMFFQADGTMNEVAIPAVTKALEAAEGISNLKVRVSEGIATIELKKQTTVQATGVASNLVEIIQGAGFKLQTLNLSFDDEEEVLV